MSRGDSYCHMQALIADGGTSWIDGRPCQLVTVIMCDDALEDPDYVPCSLTAEQARILAFELLAVAEHADRLTHDRETER